MKSIKFSELNRLSEQLTEGMADAVTAVLRANVEKLKLPDGMESADFASLMALLHELIEANTDDEDVISLGAETEEALVEQMTDDLIVFSTGSQYDVTDIPPAYFELEDTNG